MKRHTRSFPLIRNSSFSCLLCLTGLLLFSGLFYSCSKTDEPVKDDLVIWFHSYGGYNLESALKEYKTVYEAVHPDVELDCVVIPRDYNQKLLTTLAAHQSNPDVFERTSGLNLSITNVRDGQLEKLDDLYPPDPGKHFIEKRLWDQIIDGHLYGVPTSGDGGIWYYRKSVLRDAGYNDPPRDFDELIEIAEAVSSDEMKGIFPHANGGTIFAGSMMYSAGVSDARFSADGRDFLWDNDPERAVEVLEGLRRLAGSEATLLAAPQPWWDPSAIINGFTAIQWGGSWMFGEIEEALGEDFGVFIIPPFDDAPESRPVTHFGGWGLAINGYSDRKEAAREYLKWMWIDETGNDIQLDWNTRAIGPKIPPRYTVQDMAYKNVDIFGDPRLQEMFNENMKWYEPLDENAYLWDTIMGAAWSEMANGVCNTDQDISRLFRKASQTIQARLDEINSGS